jgi:hypothetical protein
MPTSDEDLQAKRDEVSKLREQVANEEAKRLERERNLSNEVEAANLDAEAANLRAQLAAAKESAKVGTVRAGATAPIEAAREAMARAQAAEQGVADNRDAQAAALAEAKAATTDENKKES